MKNGFLALAIFSSCAAFADNCPNFTGRFQNFEGEILTVAQTGCTAISVGIQENFAQPVTNIDFVLDGGRHAHGGIFWSAYWVGEKFVREPWSAAEGGELLGDREIWTLQRDGSGPSIFDQVIDASDGTIMGKKVYKKVK